MIVLIKDQVEEPTRKQIWDEANSKSYIINTILKARDKTNS